jgi:hypothetical protein
VNFTANYLQQDSFGAMPSLASRDLVGFLVAKIIDKVYSTI